MTTHMAPEPLVLKCGDASYFFVGCSCGERVLISVSAGGADFDHGGQYCPAFSIAMAARSAPAVVAYFVETDRAIFLTLLLRLARQYAPDFVAYARAQIVLPPQGPAN